MTTYWKAKNIWEEGGFKKWKVQSICQSMIKGYQTLEFKTGLAFLKHLAEIFKILIKFLVSTDNISYYLINLR